MSVRQHHVGRTDAQVPEEGKILPRELSIVWSKDSRYWRLPENDAGSEESCFAELVQVSWLEVTAKRENLKPNTAYSVGFKISFKEETFGWENPVYLMAKVGKKGRYKWKKITMDTSKKGTAHNIPDERDRLIINVTSGPQEENAIYFGLYEVWSGKWKGGLRIHYAFVEEVKTTQT